jgi:uncharacterized protein YoxC
MKTPNEYLHSLEAEIAELRATVKRLQSDVTGLRAHVEDLTNDASVILEIAEDAQSLVWRTKFQLATRIARVSRSVATWADDNRLPPFTLLSPWG